MGKPAAREGDMHVCPLVPPGCAPHMGGEIGLGCVTVLINDKPAVTVGHTCACEGAVDLIITGSSTVFINGKPAARMGDECVHGGVITAGSTSVFIGGRKFRYKGEAEPGGVGVNAALTKEEKDRAIRRAIKDATHLLETKLTLLENQDLNTLRDFKKWFGRDDGEAVRTIIERMQRALKVVKELTVENFEDRSIKQKNESLYAEVYRRDKAHTIFVNELFWKTNQSGNESKAAIVIHELSHFKDVGNTKDYVYKDRCLELTKTNPKDALANAGNFEYFVVN
ncbi:PAAR domain-containing protein [Niastella vici]|uniref:PAAR domain-containing protein n=1 Tax=Niastella vici TaxID=1703345 RepID=UPI0009BFE9B0|nr:M35 family metallo-endopeptidase [Niastella vici]